jgi:catechol 2,3-dioxygenase-like lactoylglutathione lyase family enzyme
MSFRASIAALATLVLASHADANETRPAITGISHIAVYDSDFAVVDDFYVHDLGAVKATDPENPAGVRYYFSPTQFAEVLPLPKGWTSASRLDHVAYNTSDADALRRYIGAHGFAVPKRVKHGADGSKWFGLVDPEGNVVEFVQPPADPPSVPDNPLSAHIIHVGYVVHSREAEDKFYRDVLGFKPYWYGAMQDSAPPQWISQAVPDGHDWLEYMIATPDMKLDQNQLGILNHFSLGVPNMEKAVSLIWDDRLSPRNDGAAKIGRDGKWQFNLYDPDGTRVELMEFHAMAKPCCSPFTAPDPER